jgi:hypothetical protein
VIKCSRAKCEQLAVFQIEWRNPKIHTEDRVKIWSACAQHQNFLVDYLQTRGFPVVVKEI